MNQWENKHIDDRKWHLKHKEKDRPLCGAQPSFYRPVVVVKDVNRVDCLSCLKLAKVKE